MDCEDAGPMIAAAIDDALEPSRRALLDAHIRICPACRRAFVDQRAVRAMLSSEPLVDAPADFLDRVNARIDETAGWFGLTDFRQWTLRIAPAAAALALIGVLGLGPSRWLTSTTPESVRQSAAQSVAAPVNFTPASDADWQRDVTPDALLDAALHASAGEIDVR
jgi:anti-sigma factor RsiW